MVCQDDEMLVGWTECQHVGMMACWLPATTAHLPFPPSPLPCSPASPPLPYPFLHPSLDSSLPHVRLPALLSAPISISWPSLTPLTPTFLLIRYILSAPGDFHIGASLGGSDGHSRGQRKESRCRGEAVRQHGVSRTRKAARSEVHVQHMAGLYAATTCTTDMHTPAVQEAP